jgi:hypothetical protein
VQPSGQVYQVKDLSTVQARLVSSVAIAGVVLLVLVRMIRPSDEQLGSSSIQRWVTVAGNLRGAEGGE